MEIHDLNTKPMTDPAWVPFDDGTDTYKADFSRIIDEAVARAFSAADVSGGVVNYTSGDASSPTAWTDVDVLTTGSTLATLLNKISTMIKNIRYFRGLIGSTAITGTITDNVSALSAKGAVAYTIYDERVELSADGPTSIVRAGNVCVASCYLKVKKTLAQAQTSLLKITNSTDYPMSLVSGIGLNFTKAKVVPVAISAAGNINFYHGGNIAINDTIVFQIMWIAP